MLDNPFRKILPPYLDFLLKGFKFLKLTPNHITIIAFIISVISCVLVYNKYFLVGIIVWWTSRLLDACDGIYARKYQLTSRLGAFLDIQLDMAAYGLMVLSLSFVFPEYILEWSLILFLYILCITGALGLGNLESELNLPDESGRGLRLASGLAEGGETGIFYTIFLLLPNYLSISTWIWIGVLVLTVIARIMLAIKILNRGN